MYGLTPLKAECSPAPDMISRVDDISFLQDCTLTIQPHKELVVQFCYLSRSQLHIFLQSTCSAKHNMHKHTNFLQLYLLT